MAKIDLKAVLGNNKLLNNPYVDDADKKKETIKNIPESEILDNTKNPSFKLAIKKKEIKKSVTWYMKERNSSKIHALAKENDTTTGEVLDYIIEEFFNKNS